MGEPVEDLGAYRAFRRQLAMRDAQIADLNGRIELLVASVDMLATIVRAHGTALTELSPALRRLTQVSLEIAAKLPAASPSPHLVVSDPSASEH